MQGTISAVVLTKNEEKNIERCLTSLSWCDEVVIVDDYSEDETIKKAQSVKRKAENQNLKLRVFKRHLNGDFAGQRNFGLEKAKGDWVLFVDADEIINAKLHDEIKKTIQIQAAAKIYKGYFIRRQDFFLGKWLKYGETGNIKLLRLAKRNAGRWRGKVHEVWEIKGRVGELKNPLLHYPHQSVADFLKELNWYTDFVAQCWKEEGRKMRFWEILVFPLGKFLQNYILRAGFLDRIPGLILAIFMSFHSFLARSRLWLLRNK